MRISKRVTGLFGLLFLISPLVIFAHAKCHIEISNIDFSEIFPNVENVMIQPVVVSCDESATGSMSVLFNKSLLGTNGDSIQYSAKWLREGYRRSFSGQTLFFSLKEDQELKVNLELKITSPQRGMVDPGRYNDNLSIILDYF